MFSNMRGLFDDIQSNRLKCTAGYAAGVMGCYAFSSIIKAAQSVYGITPAAMALTFIGILPAVFLTKSNQQFNAYRAGLFAGIFSGMCNEFRIMTGASPSSTPQPS